MYLVLSALWNSYPNSCSSCWRKLSLCPFLLFRRVQLYCAQWFRSCWCLISKELILVVKSCIDFNDWLLDYTSLWVKILNPCWCSIRSCSLLCWCCRSYLTFSGLAGLNYLCSGTLCRINTKIYTQTATCATAAGVSVLLFLCQCCHLH